MSALSIYASICRNLLEFNSLDDPSSEVWDETVRKLRKLRHIVQCRVCKVIPKVPYGASGCNHITCRYCKETKKGCFSGCRYCKYPTELHFDKQTESVLKCYAKVCEILRSYHALGGTSHRKDRIEKIWDLISEGVRLFEKQVTEISPSQQESNNKGNSQLPNLTNILDKHNKESDVDHVRYENKILQDGGSFQDGTRFQDGGIGRVQYKENPDKCADFKDEIDDKLEPECHKISPISLELGKDSAHALNGHFSSKNETRKVAVSKRYFKKEKQPKNCSLILNLPSDSSNLEVQSMRQEHQKDRGKILGEALNGYSCEIQLNNIDQNGIPTRKHGKRKLSPNRSSNSELTVTPSKLKEGMISKGNDSLESQNGCKSATSDELKGQEASEFFNGKSSKYCKASKQYHRNENRLVTKQEEVCAQDGGQIASKKGRHGNGHRQYSFLRKNKYKCMCGSASGLKHFNDICNHKRCVCYAAGVPCVSCKCKFCSNPHDSRYSVKWSSIGIESDVKMEQTADDGL